MVFFIALSIFSLLITTVSSSIFASASSLVDFHVLVSLKQGFQSPEPALTSWNSSNPSSVCFWDGVVCSQDRVFSLDLTDLKLGGSVSAQVSSLDMLTHLSLAGNSFIGSIEIANLTSLRSLNISNNELVAWIGTTQVVLICKFLMLIITAAFLPLGVGTLEKLKYLVLGGNYFYGKIPEGYGNLVGLEYLSLETNDLRGRILGELGNLTNLRKIRLNYFNIFEGGIPKEFGKLVNLEGMHLASCGLDGPIPPELGNLKLHDKLLLFGNLLSGSIPKQLGNLTNLLSLDLYENLLTGEIPHELGTLKLLKYLHLNHNLLSGLIPKQLGKLTNLMDLSISYNVLTGEILWSSIHEYTIVIVVTKTITRSSTSVQQ